MKATIFLFFFCMGTVLLFPACRGGAYVEEKGKAGISTLGLEDSIIVAQVPDSLFQDLGDGLKLAIIKEGEGEFVRQGSSVTVHYIGTFKDGREFENSQSKKVPFSFVPGQEMVIEGWEKAITRVRYGAKAVIEVPPDMAYGKEGREPTIPPQSTLIFYLNVLGEF